LIKGLIVEHDHTSSLFLLLLEHGEAHMAVNGEQTVKALRYAFNMGHPYDLVCHLYTVYILLLASDYFLSSFSFNALSPCLLRVI
jgi:hypothetical protein